MKMKSMILVSLLFVAVLCVASYAQPRTKSEPGLSKAVTLRAGPAIQSAESVLAVVSAHQTRNLMLDSGKPFNPPTARSEAYSSQSLRAVGIVQRE